MRFSCFRALRIMYTSTDPSNTMSPRKIDLLNI